MVVVVAVICCVVLLCLFVCLIFFFSQLHQSMLSHHCATLYIYQSTQLLRLKESRVETERPVREERFTD